MRLAEVIVDVPTRQTDQPFTYAVPPAIAAYLEPGMRVAVPFGRSDRLIQGFVMACREGEPTTELKMIETVLDAAPVLNQELLELAEYMRRRTFAFKITCLQTMLPSVMKSATVKYFVPVDLSPAEREAYFNDERLLWETAEEAGWLPQMLAWRKAEKIALHYEVKTRNKVQTQRYIAPLLTAAEYTLEKQKIRKNAVQQQELLEVLAKATNAFPQSALPTVTLATLKVGVKKGWLALEERELYRDPYKEHDFKPSIPLALNSEQQAAYEAITKSQQTFLLEGITGSGKTEVYLQVIAQKLKEDKTAIMLVPEIALTPQMVNRFKSRFGDEVAVLHSALSQGEKYDEWRKIERGEARVVVGARSAIFAPLMNIGVIIIDEEHESSYKQEETPRYHARDIALWRGEYHHCPVVLGSATPSLETRARAQKGVYQLLRLSQRANSQALLPQVEIVDMRREPSKRMSIDFSNTLMEKIQDRLTKGEQTVLMLNRRGYSSFILCRDCGFVLDCPNCDISLTLHMDTKTMKCHYCGHEERIPHHCPNCGSDKIRYFGTGTQKVEEELHQLFPQARVLRMDVDTTRKKGAHEKLLTAFGNQEADILLGTQMIAKGLDFPNVTLVGVLNADTALNLPDFRSSERTFQLLTQVSGRAGRAEKPGEVVIQSFNPEHYAIQLTQRHDYETFFREEMKTRHRGDYPPYYFTAQITASHSSEEVAAGKIYQIAHELKQSLSEQSIVLGPTPKAVMRVNNRYYYQLIIKYKQEPALQKALEKILYDTQGEAAKGLLISIDSEPMYFI
ncbi:primosomal protein N [Enterococcus canis]|uniref:Replication restart protein PriA n=1 Tax=Enterococcus canis TaxID=214095 RepID=A0A1L8RGD7_9ENTE|nr:primosomal protein N' [Enterococcus canis]OJG18830.1 primosomal protein N [Enterococcus canis]